MRPAISPAGRGHKPLGVLLPYISRSGLTLTEVLMSILVTGIGLLSVIALLPLSFVRAVQATNLTNSTILRYNAESQIYLDQLNLEYVYPKWQANTHYAVGTVPPPFGGPTPANAAAPFYAVVAAGGNSSLRFVCTADSTGTNTGKSAAAEPVWPTVVGNTVIDGDLTWTAVDHSHYVIDPLGWNMMAVNFNGLEGVLGNSGGVAGTTNPAPAGSPGTAIERFNGSINAGIDGGNPATGDAASIAAAGRRVAMLDSWIEQARGPVTVGAAPIASATLINPVSLTMGPSDPPWRIVLTDASGKISQTRLITSIASPTVSWSATDPWLGSATPAQARVEIQERRYTWMLTVRRSSSGPPSIDVTVFFRRPLVRDDEQTYNTTGSGTQFTVDYSGLPKPFAKKGGFLFDVSFGQWYRIVDIQDSGTQLTVTVDRQRSQAEVLKSVTFSSVFLRGVVDVYPLGQI